MKIDIEDIKTISIAKDEHLLINVKDTNATRSDLNIFQKQLRNWFGHNRVVVVVGCNDIEMTKIKYLDAVRDTAVWRT